MRNRWPLITPDRIPLTPGRILAAQGAHVDPEAPFLHPNVHLTLVPLSPAPHRTPPPRRSLMPNREQRSPPEPKSSPLRRTRNHTIICPEWPQNLIGPAQSSLVGAHSEASLATDGGWAWDAKTKTRRTSSQRQIVHHLRLPFFPSIPEEKLHPPLCPPSYQITPRRRPVTCLSAPRPPRLRSKVKLAGLPSPATCPAAANGLTTHAVTP